MKCKCNNCPRYARVDGYCNVHNPEKQRQYRKDNAERFKGYTLKRDYGISLELYQRMLVDQGGVCAICGAASGSERSNNNGYKTLGVDHDHSTGTVRGLLCSSCNKGLGFLMDNPILLRRAAEYLEYHQKNAPKSGTELLEELMSK
jgi:hypothetical protein